MIIFPAMDLLNGNVVKLDVKTHKKVEKIYGTPAQVTQRWLKEGAEWLHVVDLNAALGKGLPNHLALLSILPRVAQSRARVQWGGGVRDGAMLGLLLEAQLGDSGIAIDRIVVGTRAVKDWAWLESAAENNPDRIVVAIDAWGRELVMHGWQKRSGLDVVDFVGRAKNVPIAAFLYTNVKVEGRGKGVDWEPVQAVLEASPRPVIFSGGITTPDEVARFKELGVYGIIIGSALYSGAIDFADAKAHSR